MLKKALSCIISLLMVLNITIPVHVAPVQENKDQIIKADVVFVIDSLNIDLRMAIVEFIDITIDNTYATTQLIEFDLTNKSKK